MLNAECSCNIFTNNPSTSTTNSASNAYTSTSTDWLQKTLDPARANAASVAARRSAPSERSNRNTSNTVNVANAAETRLVRHAIDPSGSHENSLPSMKNSG